MKRQIKQIEKKIQDFFENGAARLLFSHHLTIRLSRELVSAMSAHLRHDGKRLVAPDHYTLMLHPEAASQLTADPEILEHLSDLLAGAAQESGVNFAQAPEFTILPDETLPRMDVRVEVAFWKPPLGQTKNLPPAADAENEQVPENAFLIIDGDTVFTLDQPVINIGRRLDNHLVIDDPRVSRLHAQLRATKGHFMISDLGSTGGTYVNGQRIRQSLLYPGDIISLAGVTLVFGQDPPRPLEGIPDTTQPLSPRPDREDHPTIVNNRSPRRDN